MGHGSVARNGRTAASRRDVEGFAGPVVARADAGAMLCSVVPVLSVRDLSVQREPDWRVALPALDLLPGQVVTLFGPSGCGKSTLLRALLALPDAALVQVGMQSCRGVDWRQLPEHERRHWRRTAVAYLPQHGVAALDPLARLDRQLAEATGAAAPALAEALQQLGVADAARLLRAHPHQVAGGEAQRALLAIAMLRRPLLLVADEPTADLDAASRDRFTTVCQRLLAGGTAVLLSSHDRELVAALGGEVLVAAQGCFQPGSAAAPPWPAWVRAAPGEVRLAAHGLSFRRGARTLFHDLAVALRAGETLAVVGDSGVGKTTLARILAGQLAATTGRLDRPAGGGAVQLVPQDAWSSLTPQRSVRSLCAEAPGPSAGPARLAELAAALHLAPDLLERSREGLSGGQAQRAALLRALYREPAVLLLDEPTHGLDMASAQAMLELVRREQFRSGLSVLLITHDQALAHAFAHRRLHLHR